jgi:hypothetical protein
MGVAGVDADYRQANPPELVPEPTRHGTGLETDAFGLRCSLAQQRRQGTGVGCHAALPDGPAGLIHDADRRFPLRHVQPDILFHCDILDWGVIPAIVAMPPVMGSAGSNYLSVWKKDPVQGR